MLPTLSLLAQVQQQILKISNQQGEYKRQIHYGCYLLCEKAGLRVSEAISFDLNSKTRQGLYRLNKPKGRKKRYVYIPKSVIKELTKHDWKPNHTNRFNFYHFLRKIKRELNLPTKIELTPHTLRRCFATYNALNGMPLPLLQKLLGHKSIRTTALYWMNIYHGGDDDDNDTGSILAGKNWLEKSKRPLLEPKAPVNLNLGELPELLIPNPLASEPSPNYLNKIQHLEEQLSQIQSKKDQKIKKLTAEKKALQTDLADSNEQNIILHQEKQQIQQSLSKKDQIIKELKRKLISERKQKNTAENNLAQERKISAEQKQTNANLTQKICSGEQNYSNLLNTYQQVLKNKQEIIKLVQTEKQRADYYENQLKSITQTLYQWQKINYYQQQWKLSNKTETKIIQSDFKPPSWKSR